MKNIKNNSIERKDVSYSEEQTELIQSTGSTPWIRFLLWVVDYLADLQKQSEDASVLIAILWGFLGFPLALFGFCLPSSPLIAGLLGSLGLLFWLGGFGCLIGLDWEGIRCSQSIRSLRKQSKK